MKNLNVNEEESNKKIKKKAITILKNKKAINESNKSTKALNESNE